ncbi:hypothetical protein DFS28_10655 [Pseudomonas sp. 478]|uniref:hypothetical protein n=1 Tax=unclassified Pseudomonas TaxID=196821 RepID=UPI000DAB75DF|nr:MULTISPECIES: hypothetical protein [unclassified Pseudomonas]PZW96159.1 hypothetical protein DFS28_10655 [Pseudomonas sp. 478]TCV52719.1 hypothetical protein EDB99_105164 [Pseudomonas sp. 460]
MKSLIQNEILGIIALQETLKNLPMYEVETTNILFVLPLLFNKKIRGLLKDRRITFLSSKDLIVSYPEIFLGLRNIYLDTAIASLNTLILAQDISMVSVNDSRVTLESPPFPYITMKEYGKIAAEISSAAPNVAKILQENPTELHLNFRIDV